MTLGALGGMLNDKDIGGAMGIARAQNDRERASVRRILASAVKCFETIGLAKTSIADIARTAGYSRPLVYKYFPGKSDIVDQVCIEEMQAIQVDLRAGLDRSQSFADKMAQAILMAVLLARRNPYIRRFTQDLSTWVRSQTSAGIVHQWVTDRWRAFLMRGQSQGVLAEDLDVEETVTWIALTQSLLLIRFDNEDIDERELLRLVRRFVVTPLLPHPS